MIKQIKYIGILFFIIVSSAVSAQQRDTTLRQEVEVTKAYKPTVTDANKIHDMPKVDEVQHQPPRFNYAISSKPIFNTFSVNPLKAATIVQREKKETGYGLIRAGAGNYNKPYGELFFNTLLTRNSVFGIHARHLSSYGKLNLKGGDRVDAPFSESEAELFYKYDFGKSVLSINGFFDHDGFRYYGYPEKEIPDALLNNDITYQGEKQAFSKGGIVLKMRNPVAESDDPVFNFDMNYHWFGTKTKQTEHFGKLNFEFQKPFETGALNGEIGGLYIQADSIYNQTLGAVGKRQQTWLYAKPSYYLGGERAGISIGFNAWFVMDNDMDALAKIAPNVRVNVTPVEDVVNLYAGIDGNYINNHYSRIAYENPFVDPMHDVTNSFEKFRFYGGLDGKLSAKTNFKISADYSIIEDQQLYYLNEYYYPDPLINPIPLIVDNTFDVLYDNVKLLKMNLEFFHKSSEKLDLLLSGDYYIYKLDEQTEAWNMPKWDATLSVEYNLTDQLSVGTDIYLIGSRNALIIEHSALDWENSEFDVPVLKSYNLDMVLDLNVNATYKITQKFSVFGQLNNFGFQQYEKWFGYPVQSFNALAGVSYAF
jgi:hypothetical protein